MQQNIHKYESSVESRDLSTHLSQHDISFTTSPQLNMEMDKTKEKP